ncbi:HTTM domain-containing protein [Roseivirga echinicomitans]
MEIQKGEIYEVFGKGKLKNLFAPIDNASIVLFRIMFGLIMLWEVTRYFKFNWIERYWVTPDYNFAYTPFNLSPLPENWMYILWYVLGVLAVCITIGLFYRISTVLFFLIFTYTFLLEQARYLNHFYLVVIVSFILIFIPAHRNFSIDSKIFKNIKSPFNASWNLWLIRFTVGIPYFFGGIAKINSDWLRGYPLKDWLLGDLSFPIIGQYFTEHWMILIMSYSGLILDLAVVPVLLFKRTGVIGFIAICLFHLMNVELFQIGIFPWFMIAATSLYFSPDWPKRVLRKIGFIGAEPSQLVNFKSNPKYQKAILYGLALYFSIQVFLPLRHWLIKGDVNWTEEGHKYSWRMKLRSKDGRTSFLVKNKATDEILDVNIRGYLKSWQERKMGGNPDMIWKFAKFLKEEYGRMGIDVEVYAQALASLNGREYQYIIDPNVDLASQKKVFFGHSEWVLLLEVPLERQRK